jgi:putative selenium metabolism protein SsnA
MLIINGMVATFDEHNRLLPDGALYIVDDRIVEIGESAQLAAKYPDEKTLNARGMWIMPGLICAHTHFYGAFARGIPLRGQPATRFSEILERLWWPLDRTLWPEDVKASAEVCAIDAIRHGTTTLVDHHASPRCVEGALDGIADVTLAAGLRACLCYEVSDRDGKDAALAGIRENVRFIKRCQQSPHPQLAGMMGLHASLTLSDDTLAIATGFADDLHVGCHIHVAEGEEDVADSLRKSGLRVVERLHSAGVLGERALAVHCVHIDAYEIDILRQCGARVVHNPRSNMNNAVGTARAPRMLQSRVRVGLGNDGFSNNMFTEMQTAYLIHKLAEGDPRVMPADSVIEMAFTNNRKIASSFFPAEVGILTPGAMADVILVDYHPTTPLTTDNLAWHIIFGVDGTTVNTTICAGNILMIDGELMTMDEKAVTARSRELARKVWARY